MAPEHMRDNEHSKTPKESALVLLAIYIALYLGVAGLVHILTLPHANAAVARSGSSVSTSAVPAPGFPVGALEPAAKEATDPASESTSDPRQCKPGSFDSNCLYD